LTKYLIDFEAEISSGTAAQALGLSSERVNQLKREGIFGNSLDRLTLKSVLNGYHALLQADRKRTSKTLQESQLMAARRQKVELETAQMSGELIHLDEALEISEQIVSKVRVGLAGLPSQVTRNPVERHRISILCGRILADIAAAAGERGKALEALLDASGAGRDDAAGRVGGEVPEVSAGA
jgi:hypothetical protein